MEWAGATGVISAFDEIDCKRRATLALKAMLSDGTVTLSGDAAVAV
ncbi:hypothetical protein [Mycolicibacterium fortuitum]|nr:hypothetical protein [Mycolicibacterium fortuitum]